MEDKNKISHFIRRRLENFDHEAEDWETPDSSIRTAILNQQTSPKHSYFHTIKPLPIVALLLISILGITSFIFFKKQQQSQLQIAALLNEVQSQNDQLNELSNEVITLQNQKITRPSNLSHEFATHDIANHDSNVQKAIATNTSKSKTYKKKLNTNNNNVFSTYRPYNSLGVIPPPNSSKTINNKRPSSDNQRANVLDQNDRQTLNDIALDSKNFLDVFESPLEFQNVNSTYLIPTSTEASSKNQLYVGAGIQFKPRPFRTEHKFNKKPSEEGKPHRKVKTFYNRFIQAEYMLSDQLGMYTGFGSALAKVYKKSNFNYQFDHKNTIINSNGEQYNEIEFRSSSNFGENESLVSFEVPEGIQDTENINVALANTYTIKTVNIPLGLNYYLKSKNNWSPFIQGGLDYENIYIHKYDLIANVQYKSKPVKSRQLYTENQAKKIQQLNLNLGIGTAYDINSSWRIQGNLQWNKNLFNNSKKNPPKHFDVDAKVGVYYKI